MTISYEMGHYPPKGIFIQKKDPQPSDCES